MHVPLISDYLHAPLTLNQNCGIPIRISKPHSEYYAQFHLGRSFLSIQDRDKVFHQPLKARSELVSQSLVITL